MVGHVGPVAGLLCALLFIPGVAVITMVAPGGGGSMYGRRQFSRYRYGAGEHRVPAARVATSEELVSRLAAKDPTVAGLPRVDTSAAKVGGGLAHVAAVIERTPHVASLDKEQAAVLRYYGEVGFRSSVDADEPLYSLALCLLGHGLSAAQATAVLQWYCWGLVSTVMAHFSPATAAAYAGSVTDERDRIVARDFAKLGVNGMASLALAQRDAVVQGASVGGGGPNPGGSKLNSEDGLLTRSAYGLGRGMMALTAGVQSWQDNRTVETSSTVKVKSGDTAGEVTETVKRGPVPENPGPRSK